MLNLCLFCAAYCVLYENEYAREAKYLMYTDLDTEYWEQHVLVRFLIKFMSWFLLFAYDLLSRLIFSGRSCPSR